MIMEAFSSLKDSTITLCFILPFSLFGYWPPVSYIFLLANEEPENALSWGQPVLP